MRIATHNGHFHTDDVMAVATLLLKFPDSEIIRTRDETVLASADFVVDVGQIHDAETRFDHHQKEGAGLRDNGIPYASFGLVWKRFGEELAGGKEEAEIIDFQIVAPVDAKDNGINVATNVYEEVGEYTLGDFLESYAAQAEGLEDYDKIFNEVLPIAQSLLMREIKVAKKSVEDRRETKRIYDESEDKRLIVLPHHARWKYVLIESEAIYVVYPRPDGKWAVQAVPAKPSEFESKKKFPSAWAGLDEESLSQVTGVPDAIFCHRERFLAVAQSKEGAIELARIALNA